MWALLLILTLGADAVPASAVSIDDIVAGLRQNEAALGCLEVRSKIKMLQLSFASKQEVALENTLTYQRDASGRIRIESMGQTFEDGESPKVIPLRVLATFDGTRVKNMTGSDEFHRGYVGEDRLLLFLAVDPYSYLTHYRDLPVSSQLAEGGFTVGEPAEWEGAPVIVLNGPELGTKPPFTRISFWVDAKKNFAIVRRSISYRFDPHEWREHSLITGHDHVQDHSGVWFPRRVVIEERGRPVSSDIEPLRLYRHEVQNQTWTIGGPLDEQLFELEFSDGIFVQDEIAGRSYLVSSMNNEASAQQVCLSEMFAGQRESSVRLWTLLSLNVAVISILGIWLTTRQWRRS